MATRIDTLLDKNGDTILPRTRTKAIYDDDNNRLDNTLKELAESVTPISLGGTGGTTVREALGNFKIYNGVDQLGLSYPCTTVDIIKAMPTQSEVKIAVNGLESSITDLPEPFCILTIRYDFLNRYQIFATQMTANGSSGTYIGNYVRNTSISWEKIITDSTVLVGKDLTGQTVSPTAATTVTAGDGAEIFNDYRTRTYTSQGVASVGNVAAGTLSHAEGYATTAVGEYAHAEGCWTQANGDYSHAEGYETIANDWQSVTGRCNISSSGPAHVGDVTGDIFIIGNGTARNERSNAFRVTTAGKAYGLANFSGSGAGVAELYEWQDGNPDNEDRRGLFVTLDGEKIKIASPDDDYILGTIDPCPYVVGDVQSEIWKDMYLKDVFGEKMIETVEVEETTDENGQVIPAHTEERWILNPEYDPTQKYISRDERSEFVAITSKGKVVMIDDGTCQVNGYCTVGENGVATASETNYAVRVMERIDDTHIKVYIDSVFINK